MSNDISTSGKSCTVHKCNENKTIVRQNILIRFILLGNIYTSVFFLSYISKNCCDVFYILQNLTSKTAFTPFIQTRLIIHTPKH